MAEVATGKSEIEQAIEEFARENPEVSKALEIFGIAASEYEDALRALYPSTIYTGSSTQPMR